MLDFDSNPGLQNTSMYSALLAITTYGIGAPISQQLANGRPFFTFFLQKQSLIHLLSMGCERSGFSRDRFAPASGMSPRKTKNRVSSRAGDCVYLKTLNSG